MPEQRNYWWPQHKYDKLGGARGVTGSVGQQINGRPPQVGPMPLRWVYLHMLGTDATCSLSCHSDPVD